MFLFKNFAVDMLCMDHRDNTFSINRDIYYVLSSIAKLLIIKCFIIITNDADSIVLTLNTKVSLKTNYVYNRKTHCVQLI